MQSLSDLINGKTVAIVGNASSSRHKKLGKEIDAHNVVVRCNLGFLMPAEDVGSKTTVWAAAKLWKEDRQVVKPESFALMVFMKLTQLGDRHWEGYQKESFPMERWPAKLERECEDFVGASPSTGIRMLWFARKKAKPKSISVFGMDNWDTPTNWSGRMNAPSHIPKLERLAMERLMEASK